MTSPSKIYLVSKKPWPWMNKTEHEDYVTRVFEVTVPEESNSDPIQPLHVGENNNNEELRLPPSWN